MLDSQIYQFHYLISLEQTSHFLFKLITFYFLKYFTWFHANCLIFWRNPMQVFAATSFYYCLFEFIFISFNHLGIINSLSHLLQISFSLKPLRKNVWLESLLNYILFLTALCAYASTHYSYIVYILKWSVPF